VAPPSRNETLLLCAIFGVAYLLLEVSIREDARDAAQLRARGERVVTRVTGHQSRAGGGSRVVCDNILTGTTREQRAFSVRSLGPFCPNATPLGTEVPVVVLPEKPEQVWMRESDLARPDESWGKRLFCFCLWGLLMLPSLVAALRARFLRGRQP
jgi:hypothetical protein